MLIDYEWINREPFLECDSHNVESWLFQLCAKGWLTESGKNNNPDDPEAISYRSITIDIPKNNRQNITGYTSGTISAISEIYRKTEKWNESLKLEISGELYSPRSIPNWNNLNLQVSGELDL